jgi:hypothetical protein
MARELKWGQTPWDHLSQPELLREVQRMYAALESTRSVLNILSAQARTADSFWSERGSGGKALSRANQVIEPVQQEYDPEDIYRAFFRYATSLLFEVDERERWYICPVCGIMLSGENQTGQACQIIDIPGRKESNCPGIMRPLEWQDLAPQM